MAARTRLLLEGPVAPTLLRLAAPNVLVMVLQATVSTLDAVFVGWLGGDALAGVSVVFPLVMLMQTMSAGGMGGGVASAVARALGAGRQKEADALVAHALIIALGMGALFTAAALAGGPWLYRAMGGTGGTLDAALAYSHVIFGGAVAYWLYNTLSAVVRGTGNMALPATVMVANGAIYLALSPALIMGWGPLPRLGVAGAAAASVTSFALGSVVLGVYLASGRSLVTLSLARIRPRWALFRDILRVGAPGSLNTVFTNLTIVLVTALVGPFGAHALAGYGMGARLEYLQIPLVFGLGAALVTMVGTNIGAGNLARAQRVAWVGSGLAALVTGAVGLFGALFPHVWLGLFSKDAEVLAAGTLYLRTVGPLYGFFGLGLALYFASQGAGRLGWPLFAGFARLAIAGGVGFIAVRWLGWRARADLRGDGGGAVRLRHRQCARGVVRRLAHSRRAHTRWTGRLRAMTTPMTDEQRRIKSYLTAQAAKLEPAAIIAKVRDAMAELEAAAVALPSSRFTERPAPEEWSGDEVMAHVMGSDAYFGGGIVSILDDRPPPAREERGGSAERATRSADEWCRALARDREALFERVRAASPDDRPDRTIEHGMFGPLTWREALLLLRLHDLDHAGQLRQIATALPPATGDALPSA